MINRMKTIPSLCIPLKTNHLIKRLRDLTLPDSQIKLTIFIDQFKTKYNNFD